MSLQLGFYKWSYQGGVFDVCFRPFGVFYCEKYPAQGRWEIQGNKLLVDWKNFGKYEFNLTNGPAADGCALGNPANWRKIEYYRDFNVSERILLGDGYGSVWNFQYEGGAFDIEFRCDGFNHFVCPQYPAHSHWTIDDAEVIKINWGKFGEYVMKIDPATGLMAGNKKDQPSNWRRATLVRKLTVESLASLPAHDHSHEHVHGSNCSSGCKH